MSEQCTDKIDRTTAEEDRELLEQDDAKPCKKCGGVVFEWWESDTCGECDSAEETSTEQATLVTDGGQPARPAPEDGSSGLVSPKECDGCGDWVETAVGMDSYVEIAEFDTTEHDKWVFCDWSCFDGWYQSARIMELIPGVPESETSTEERSVSSEDMLGVELTLYICGGCSREWFNHATSASPNYCPGCGQELR